MEDVVDLTRDLVNFNTVEGEEGEVERCLDYIKRFFDTDDFVLQEFENNGEKVLIVGFEETLTPEVLVHGHIDVVSADDEMFEPELRDGCLHGRGTADMKAGVACLMKLMQRLRSRKPDVALMLTTDEETGGFDGAKHMVEERGLRPSFAISAEPSTGDRYMDIVTEQKGVARATIRSHGRSAHASRPWKGENAAEQLIHLYTEEVKPMFDDANSETWSTTVNLGRMESGDAANKVPEEATMHLDIRWTQQLPASEVKNRLEGIEQLELESWFNDPMLKTDAENQYVQTLEESCRESGFDVETTRKNAASDMRHFSTAGIPAVVFGPEGYDSHEPSERAVVGSMEDYISALERFAERL
jgi:succinyl-diaminopimelate desuccinylase